MSAIRCIHCMLQHVAETKGHTNPIAESLASSTTTIAYVRAYGVEDVIASLCKLHGDFAKKMLDNAPAGAPGRSS